MKTLMIAMLAATLAACASEPPDYVFGACVVKDVNGKAALLWKPSIEQSLNFNRSEADASVNPGAYFKRPQ